MSKSGKFDYLKKLTQAERKQILDMKKAQGEKKGQISKAETSKFLKNKGVSKLSDILKKQDLKQGFEKIRSEGLKRIPTVSDWLGDAIRQGEEELKKEEAKLTELKYAKKFEKEYNQRKKLLDILKKQGLKQGLEELEKNKRDKQIEELQIKKNIFDQLKKRVETKKNKRNNNKATDFKEAYNKKKKEAEEEIANVIKKATSEIKEEDEEDPDDYINYEQLNKDLDEAKRLSEIDNDKLQYDLRHNEIPPNLRNQIRHAEEAKLDFLENEGLSRAEIQQRKAEAQLNLLKARAEEDERLKRQFQEEEKYEKPQKGKAVSHKGHSHKKTFNSLDDILEYGKDHPGLLLNMEAVLENAKTQNIEQMEQSLIFNEITQHYEEPIFGLSKQQRNFVANTIKKVYEAEKDEEAYRQQNEEQREIRNSRNFRPIITNRGILAEPNTIYEEMGSVSKPGKFRINRAYGEDVSTFYPEAGLYGKEGLAQLRNKYNIEVPEHIRKLLKQKGK